MMQQIKIDINLAVVIFFLVGIAIGFLGGMIFQNAILVEQFGELFEKIKVENIHFDFNQIKFVQDLWNVYSPI